MKFHRLFEQLEDSARPLVMEYLAVRDVCPRCRRELSARVIDSWRSGRRIHCTRCDWTGTWRTGTVLSRSKLSCSQFLLLEILLHHSNDDRRIADSIGVHQDTISKWRQWFISHRSPQPKEVK